MSIQKQIALVAHDNRKQELVEWVGENWEVLVRHHIICTGTTGKLVKAALEKQLPAEKLHMLSIHILKSGPLGGDQQLGALISEQKVDIFIFFWDPMTAQPHDVDVKALLRISVLYNIPTACNRSSADFLIGSRYFEQEYDLNTPNFTSYTSRELPS